MQLFLITIYSFFLIIDLSLSCGISTHIEIAHRAAVHYDYIFDQNLSAKKLIEKYQSAFQAGNPYPDSYYPSICKKGLLADVSEDTHWVPFLNATIRYIQKTYKKPFNESHQMADVTWHSLGVVQGFLSSMGYVNFHGSFDKAHSVGDFGGDVVNQFELNTKYISDLGEWYVPYNDLYNIYKDLYGIEKITKAEIIECSSLLFLGRLGEQIAVSLLYADYFKKSAFMTDRLNDFFLGGLDDMATWTQISWNKFFFMLENGVEKCKLDHNIMFIDCNQTNQQYKSDKKYSKSIEPHFETTNLDASYYELDVTDKGVYIRSTLKYKKYLNFKLGNKFSQEANATYFILNDNAQLGWSMCTGDLDNDGHDDLIVGAPVYSELNSYQNGAVFAVTSAKKSIPFENLNLEEKASFIIKPPSDVVSSRFGHSVTVLDINSDGFNDIVVSAPSYSLQNISYEGRVFIYFGDKTLSYKFPNVTIFCHKFKYCNLGWKISSGDVNLDGKNDLIISSPFAATCNDQCGFVSVILNSDKIKSQIDITDSNWFITGNMAYEWFGFSIKAKFGYLAVGAPQSRKCHLENCQISDQDIQSAGRVYLFKYPSLKPVIILNGDKELAQFGYNIDMSHQVNNFILAVSSVTEDTRLDNADSFELNRAGVVRIFNLKQDKYELLSVIKSDRPYSAFGSSLKFYKIDDNREENLFISAQMRSQSIILIDHIQEGMVFEFQGGNNLFQNLTDKCSFLDLNPCPQKHSRYFTTSQKRSRFGFDFAFAKAENKTIMAVSAIHSDNQNARLSGQIKLFDI